MTQSDRTGFVIFQQALARQALYRGELGAARGALRVLRTSDFFGGASVSESYFAVLRDHRSTEDEIRDAVTALVKLRPAGMG
jgi:hypothetical protein